MAAVTTTDPGTNGTSSSSGWQPADLAPTASFRSVEQDELNGIEDQVEEILKSLSTRGKGQYYCPYGIHCKGGGVDADIKPILFERNSYFRCAKFCFLLLIRSIYRLYNSLIIEHIYKNIRGHSSATNPTVLIRKALQGLINS